MVLDPLAGQFTYYERRGNEKVETGQTHDISSFPPAFGKKMTLLQHFRNYLDTGNPPMITPASHPVPYVKKWTTTDHAIIFRMSHKVVQVCFQDKTELILCSDTKMVIYVSKLGERLTMTLNNAMESENVEMTKRLKYTKDVLARMLQGHGHTGGTSERRSG
jgi:polo-like kinase 1